MSTSSLLEVMTQEVAHERARILACARSEAERVLAATREEAARRRREAVQAAEAELAETAQRARERAEAQAEMIVLTAKDTITDEILATVAEDLERIVSRPEFAGILEALLDELLIDTAGSEVVLAPAAHVEHCGRWLAAHGYEGIEVRGVDTLEDGVAVQDARRSFRITNTLSARLAGLERRLRKLCLDRLLPDRSRPDDGRTG